MTKLDLLLINPGGAKKKIYPKLNEDYTAIEPPFWAALTAGFFRSKNYQVKILDENAENIDHKETVNIVEDYNPKITNIVVYGQHPSASTQLMTSVSKLCEEIKRNNPNRKIILTGLHPSALPERTIKEEKCDFVGQGEGFYTIEGLLKNSPFKKIRGLWWKEGEKVFHNERAQNIENLTKELGEVAWDLLPIGKYRAHNWQCLNNLESRLDYGSLSTSLGCPFKCNFCSIQANFAERKIRYWDPKWVIDQMETLNQKYGVKTFKFIDEMFVFNSKHYLPIANGLIERDLGKEINIWSYARVDTVQEKYLEKLSNAGFKWMCVGFEAGNERVRKDANKGKFTKEDMEKVKKLINNSGINVLGNYVFGLPEDDLESMKETLDLAKELNCEFANFYCAIAWPGSPLYDQVIKGQTEMPAKWEDYAQHAEGFIPLPTKYLSSKQVLEFRDKSFYEYFTEERYLNMIDSKFGVKAKEHIQNMTKLKLKRNILES